MPCPIVLSSGVYHLNVRVPKALLPKIRGRRLTLPVGEDPVTVKAGDKVIVSLRAKDAVIAKARFAVAVAALEN